MTLAELITYATPFLVLALSIWLKRVGDQSSKVHALEGRVMVLESQRDTMHQELRDIHENMVRSKDLDALSKRIDDVLRFVRDHSDNS